MDTGIVNVPRSSAIGPPFDFEMGSTCPKTPRHQISISWPGEVTSFIWKRWVTPSRIALSADVDATSWPCAWCLKVPSRIDDSRQSGCYYPSMVSCLLLAVVIPSDAMLWLVCNTTILPGLSWRFLDAPIH